MACLSGDVRDRHASVVADFLPTPFAADGPHTDPSRALGPPDGRTVAIGLGGAIVLRFFRDIPNGQGPDVRIVEIGPDDARARVAVSEDGSRYYEFEASATASGATLYDLDEAGITRARFVRIRGVDNNGLDPGFDLDAIEALN